MHFLLLEVALIICKHSKKWLTSLEYLNEEEREGGGKKIAAPKNGNWSPIDYTPNLHQFEHVLMWNELNARNKKDNCIEFKKRSVRG